LARKADGFRSKSLVGALSSEDQMTARVFAIRAVATLVAVLSFAAYEKTSFETFEWIGLIFYFVCFFMYLRALFIALFRTKRVTADLLVVTVMVVSFLAGHHLSGALVAWFISMGLALAISFAIIERTRSKIDALTKESGKAVRIIRDGKILEMPIEQVRQGDVAIVPQGETIPVDGKIVDGASAIDESVITGEPFPVFKKAGEADGYHWALRPEEKTAIEKDLSAQGPTVMVGDGVNDATSLAAADVGISIGHTKADLAIKSSDIIVLRDDARSLLAIIKMGKKLIRVIKQNYAWAIGFNTVGIALATTGVG
jgi:cation transport ATPase